MPTYERTHPWLEFETDLRAPPVGAWMLLGEARSKCEHVAAVPLQPATARRLHSVYLAKGVRATTAIAGLLTQAEDSRRFRLLSWPACDIFRASYEHHTTPLPAAAPARDREGRQS